MSAMSTRELNIRNGVGSTRRFLDGSSEHEHIMQYAMGQEITIAPRASKQAGVPIEGTFSNSDKSVLVQYQWLLSSVIHKKGPSSGCCRRLAEV